MAIEGAILERRQAAAKEAAEGVDRGKELKANERRFTKIANSPFVSSVLRVIRNNSDRWQNVNAW